MAPLVGRLVDRVVPPALGREFRPFLGSTWFSNLSDGVQLAAGPLLVASQTTSPSLVALATVLQRLPWFLFGLGAGLMADRLDRRTILLVGNLLRVGVLALVALAVAGDRIGIALVLIALFVLGTVETVADISAQSMVPSLVPDEQLGIANARIGFGFQGLNHLVGPPLGAALFASAMAVPFMTQAVLLAFAALLVLRLEVPHVEPTATGSAREDLADGLRWVWNSPPVRTLAITIFVFNITWGATFAIQVLYAIEVLELSERGFGVFLAMSALGGLLGASIYGWLEARFSLGGLMRVVLTYEVFSHLGFALTTSAIVASVVLFLFGIGATTWGTLNRSIRQRAVPEDLQGRVGAVYMIAVHTGLVIGGVVGGTIGSWFGIVAVYWYAFVGTAVLLALVWRELPKIAHAGAPASAS
ncbi:MAG: MFS transporter [Actinomycetota bacterium]